MTDAFRSPVAPAVEPTGIAAKSSVGGESTVQVPFTDYPKEKGHPYTVDYFQLGDTWEQAEGGFGKEVSKIETFLEDQVDKGLLPNNTEAIKEAIKKMERFVGIDKNERNLMRVEKIAAYVEFLMKCDNIKFNIRRYGSKQ